MVKKKNKALSIIMAFMILFSTMIPTTVSHAATEKSLSDKTWSSSMTAILKSKDGGGYNENGMCTGYVAWAINHSSLYDVPSWPSNGFVSDFEQRLKDMGVTEVSVSDAKPGDIVFFGDEHVAILGADGKLHHNTNSGVMSGQHTIAWWIENGGNKAGKATVYRGFKQEIEVEIAITKVSANKTFTDGNVCYSLAGAKYGVYSGSTLLKTLTTNSSGVAKATISVMPDVAKNLTIKEISSSPGYGKDTTVYKKDGSSGKVVITSKEPPAGDPITVLLYKADSETGKYLNAGKLKEYYPQKGGSLAGAVFEVKFYGVEKADLDGAKALRTWYVETDENGYVRLGDKWLADGYTQSAFYKDASTGAITLPLGTVTIQEIVAPEGYHLNDDMFVSSITQTGENVIVNTYQEPIIKDQIKRGDFDFTKIADDTSHRLANVPFMITALNEDGEAVTDGESHIIVTDENGYASTANSFNAHSKNTNANDKAWNGSKIDESKLNPQAGIWFGEIDAVNKNKGALPYGKYRLDELPCEANEGYTLIKGVEVTVSRDGYTVKVGTLSDKKIEIGTTLWDGDINEERVTLARDNITLTDRVSYEGLVKGERYTIDGILMDKATGEPIIVDGKEVTSSTTFKATGKSGTVDIDFTFDASSLRGKTIVAFEVLSLGDLVIASHEDISDLDQSIEFTDPEVGTTAIDTATECNYSANVESVTVKDTVTYEDLLRGYTYKIVGTMMDKETGEPIIINGEMVTSEKTFTTNKGRGTIEMEFTFDARSLAGKDLVVFEEIYFDEDLVAEHKDINDEGQTIHFPEIKTTAIDAETNSKNSYADDSVTIKDEVAYKNFKPGLTYKLIGKVMDKETGEPLMVGDEEVVSEAEFTAEEPSGIVDVEFTFNGSDLKGKTIVIFEKAYYGDKLLAVHEDIKDEKQTIWFPEISTSAIDGETESKNSNPDEQVTIIDTVKFNNLIKGNTYRVSGKIMDKESGNPLTVDGKEITAETEFVAEDTSGSIELTFTFDGSALKGKTVVVFEKMYYEDALVAVHADINDKDQSIHFPEIGTIATDKADGDKSVYAEKKVTIKDTVKYKNLAVGERFVVKGYLVDKETGKPLLINDKKVTAEKAFIATSANGTIEVEFTFDARELKDHSLVVFEKLYHAESGIEVASHEDVNDEGQTVVVKKVPDNNPKTGDDSNMIFWIILLIASGAGVIAARVIARKREVAKSKEDNE